jgi:hypothetical protein
MQSVIKHYDMDDMMPLIKKLNKTKRRKPISLAKWCKIKMRILEENTLIGNKEDRHD